MSTFALASEVITDGGTDIVQRTVNFVLFAGLVWYLIAEPVKDYFNSRSEAIADELKKIQEKLNESISLKEEALIKISDAEKFAEELAVTAQKESKIIHETMIVQSEAELENLAKQQDSLMEFEQRKMINNVVENILDEVLSQSGKSFDKKAMANVILKKVA
jgi:F-type H+-transporting ATPase subunit b